MIKVLQTLACEDSSEQKYKEPFYIGNIAVEYCSNSFVVANRAESHNSLL